MAVIKKPRQTQPRKFRSRQQVDGQTEDGNEPDYVFTGPPQVVSNPISLNHIIEQKAKYNDNCFGCRWRFGKPADPDKKQDMNKLWQCFIENNGKISEQALYQLLSKTQYNLFIKPYEKIKHANFTLPPLWTVELIQEHFEHHCTILELELQTDHRKLVYLCDYLLDHVGKDEQKDPLSGHSECKPDPDMIKVYLTARKEKEALATRIATSAMQKKT